eukprot:jgi/Chrzof1/4205/Cz14g03020.t1
MWEHFASLCLKVARGGEPDYSWLKRSHSVQRVLNAILASLELGKEVDPKDYGYLTTIQPITPVPGEASPPGTNGEE